MLLEQLDSADAALLGIDPNKVTYTQLSDLATATEKARRDAPATPVHDIATTISSRQNCALACRVSPSSSIQVR